MISVYLLLDFVYNDPANFTAKSFRFSEFYLPFFVLPRLLNRGKTSVAVKTYS